MHAVAYAQLTYCGLCGPQFRQSLSQSVARFGYFRASVENLQVAVIREEPMALLAGRLANHAELDHVLQGLRHSGRRERKMLGCCRDRDDRLALKVLVDSQN